MIVLFSKEMIVKRNVRSCFIVQRRTKKVKNKIVEYNLYLIARNGSGSNSYVVSNNLPQWRSVVKLIKDGAGVILLKIFNGFKDQKKKTPQYVLFRCGRAQINKSLKKIEESNKITKKFT